MTENPTCQYKKELARVERAEMYIEEHGILTFFLDLDKESGMQQGFGGYSLDGYDEKLKRRIGTDAGMDFVLQMLQIFHVDRLEKIKGKMCYALYDSGSSRIIGIETLKIDGGKQFVIKDWCKQWGIED